MSPYVSVVPITEQRYDRSQDVGKLLSYRRQEEKNSSTVFGPALNILSWYLKCLCFFSVVLTLRFCTFPPDLSLYCLLHFSPCVSCDRIRREVVPDGGGDKNSWVCACRHGESTAWNKTLSFAWACAFLCVSDVHRVKAREKLLLYSIHLWHLTVWAHCQRLRLCV